MDEWFNYLYVRGVIDDNTMGNPLIKSLYYEYKRRFPDNPIDEDFFFNNTPDEQVKLLYDAIYNYQPIENHVK